MPDGALFLERTGEDIFAHHIFPDIGDVAPFFYYFGEKDFIETQLDLYQKTLQNGLLISDFPTLGVSGLVKTYEYTDLILGLLTVWEADPTPRHKEILDQTIDAAIHAFALKTNPRSFYYPRLGMRLPVIDTRDATLIECFVSLYRATGSKEHLQIAYNIFNTLIKTKFFKTYGMFADYEPTNLLARLALRTSEKTHQATLCKNNTNALFGILDLYRATQDQLVLAVLERLTEMVLAKARIPQGALMRRYVPGTVSTEADLTASFPVLDYLCDLAMEVPSWKERAIKAARANADFWLSKRGTTGLMPVSSEGTHTFFDSETDMSIGLYKLAEVTGDSTYSRAADELVEAVLRYHAPHDYALEVDINSGEVINPTQRTKFLCLFLKVLILKIEQGRGITIYGSPSLFELLKDR